MTTRKPAALRVALAHIVLDAWNGAGDEERLLARLDAALAAAPPPPAVDVERLAQALDTLPQQPFQGGFTFRYWKYEAMAAAIAAEYTRLTPAAPAKKVSA